jgi:predicted HTH transcriptional regulator
MDERDKLLNAIQTFWGQWGESPVLPELRRRRALKLGLAYPRSFTVEDALSTIEGQEIEFMEKYPEQAHDLAKEVAAFGTSNPGLIFLGITDDRQVVGLPGLETVAGKDALQRRIEGVTTNSVRPSLAVRILFEEFEDKNLVRIEVPKGPQAVYFSGNVPYLRHGSMSRPAQPAEVVELVRDWLARAPQA